MAPMYKKDKIRIALIYCSSYCRQPGTLFEAPFTESLQMQNLKTTGESNLLTWQRLSTHLGNEWKEPELESRNSNTQRGFFPLNSMLLSKNKGGRQSSYLPSLFSHCFLVLYKRSLLWTYGKRNLTHQLSTPSLFSTRTMGLRLYLASGHGIRPISSLNMWNIKKQLKIRILPFHIVSIL